MGMNRKQLNQMCERDRFEFMHGTEKDIPFVKKCNADLLAKMIMMLCQSFGRRASCPCLFVDEVRNRSMSGNLHNTMDNCRAEYHVINFRERKSAYPHAKVGFIRPAALMLAACVSHAVIYIAALSSISSELIDASMIDGCSKLKRIWYIDIPAIMPTVVTLLIMNMGTFFGASTEKMLLLQTDLNIAASETIGTYTYKLGFIDRQYGYSAAVDLFTNLVNFTMLMLSNFIARRVSDSSLF